MLTIVIALKALIELGLMFCLVRALASALLPPSGAGGALLQVLGWTLVAAATVTVDRKSVV